MKRLTLTIRPDDPEPPFEQLKAQLRDLVAAGTLAAGDKLPTVRALAEQVGLAPNTVARAYRELEQTGLLDTRGRSGTFVSGDLVGRAAREAAAAYAATIDALGVDPEEALALAARALGRPERRP